MTPYGGRCAPRYFDISVDATYFQFDSSADSRNLVSRGAANNFVLNTDQQDFDFQAGMRITAQRTFRPGTYFEFSYIGIGNWDSQSTVTGPNNLFSAYSDFGTSPVGGYAETDNGSFATLNTSNRFDSFELNIRRMWTAPNCWWHGTYWGGMRYVRVEDEALLVNQGPTGSLDYQMNVSNDLLGVQVGGDLAAKLTTRLALSGFLEVGVYGQRGGHDSTFTFGGVTSTESAAQKRASMVAEGGVLGTFRLHPRATLRLGYQTVYVNGIALATDSMNFDMGAAGDLGTAIAARQGLVDDNGTAVYHGPTAGFEYLW